ncbi:MAG: HAD hydrolase-like protein [Dehalococcoidia bacterium]|nr:HAD hydrolase-like protein [Dehalococcoidia bacterium]
MKEARLLECRRAPCHAPAMTRYRHVAWDWNGTLLEDTHLVVDVMNRLLERRGLPRIDAESYRDLFAFPVRDYYAAVGFDFDQEPFEELAREWVASLGDRWREARLRADAIPALDRIAAMGLRQSVVSASEQALLHRQAEHFEVASRFHSIVGIQDFHAAGKVEAARDWLARLDERPEDILLVGDTTHDVEVARDLGIDIVLVADGHQSRASSRSHRRPRHRLAGRASRISCDRHPGASGRPAQTLSIGTRAG